MRLKAIVRCSSCQCELEETSEYGTDVRRCPSCGMLWVGPGGLDRLRNRLRDGRLAIDMGWQDLSASLVRQPLRSRF
jgi:Zn-finger nucleic acid-binding protein